MKKKMIWLLVFAAMTAFSCAQGETALPDAVIRLCASVHPGYEIAVSDGWGDESSGQFALILKQGEDNILCMAEKAREDAAYQLTIDNTNAVYDGGALPGLLIDSGGDSLWYTYIHEDDSSAHYGALKEKGRWGQVSVLSYWPKEDGFTGIWAGISESDGRLCYEETDEDENENIRSRWTYAPIAVEPEFSKSLELAGFNINTFDNDPRDGLYPLMKNEAFVRSQSANGETIRDIAISRVHAARLFDTADGGSLLRVDDWDGASFESTVILSFAGDAGLDTYHAGEGEVYVSTGVMMYSVERADVGSWYVYGVDDSGVRKIGPDYAAPDGRTTVYRNDGYIYGSSPWGVLRGQRVTLAPSYEAMFAQTDQNAYALVCNPKPADRLHLRAKPDKNAHSYGKFYNRTPVLVLEHGKIWTKVQIGRGDAAMIGYMMTKYLVSSKDEKAALACAFPQKILREELKDGAPMHSAPEAGAVTDLLFKQEPDDFIIGVSGDDWYIVLRADGAAGYVPQSAFWDGNG